MTVHVECPKRTFNVLALRTVMYFLSGIVTLIPLVFPSILTETFH